MSLKLVIFDMDGVLIDSESKYDNALSKLLGELRVALSAEQRQSFMGAGSAENAARLKEWFPELPFRVAELEALYLRALYLTLLREVTSMTDGASEFIDRVRAEGIMTALASSSARASVTLIAERFDLDRRMDVILTGNDVSRSKPDPEIFLTAASRLDVSPTDCLVIEDSENGIAAAKEAGMSVAAFTGALCSVPSPIGRADTTFSRFDEAAFSRLIGQPVAR